MADRLSVPVDEVVAAITTKLRSAGYMESTIRLQSREARRLGRWCHEHGGGQYTAVLGAAFAADVVNPRTGRFSQQRYQSFGRLNRLADSYLLTGRVDLSIQHGGAKAMPVNAELLGLLAAWEQDMADRGLSVEFRNQSAEVTRRFLLRVEANGRRRVDEITGGDVTEFVTHLAETWPAGAPMWRCSVLSSLSLDAGNGSSPLR